MHTFKIFTDSSSDLSDQFYQEHDIGVIPFYVTFDKKNYYKEKVDITVNDFYKKIEDKSIYPATSLPSVSDYETVFRETLQQGQDIICLCLTAKFSGSYQSGVTAKDVLKEEFPDRKITVIDSMLATGLQGLAIAEVVKMRANGLTYEQIVSNIEKQKLDSRLILTVDELTYLQKGGRIGKASALIGGLMQVKPIIILKDGELVPVAKIRGRSKAIQKMLELTLEYVGDHKDDYVYSLVHAMCIDEAEDVQKQMSNLGIELDLPIIQAGTTIGCHTGPSLLTINMLRKYEAL